MSDVFIHIVKPVQRPHCGIISNRIPEFSQLFYLTACGKVLHFSFDLLSCRLFYKRDVKRTILFTKKEINELIDSPLYRDSLIVVRLHLQPVFTPVSEVADVESGKAG